MEAIATGAAANISSETAKGIFQEVKRHIRYVTIYKKHVEKFEEKLQMLIAKRISVQQEVDAADRNGEKIKADVDHWRNTVDKKIKEKEKNVRDLQDKAKSKCVIGLCPNIWSRYQLSRKAEEDAAAFDELLRQCQFNGSVGYRDVPEAKLDASTNGFETFQSREKVLEDIMEALKDSTVSMIGVYGMSGVGKTTLVNEVARQVEEVKLFDWVVTVSVTQTPDILKIQEEIAELLGLKLEEKSRAVRALRLRERLKKEKRVLFVLDDIWGELDLKEVGIPLGDEEKICKILLTSRNQNVLLVFDGMVSQNILKMDVLEQNEAWDLFKKMAGDILESSDELRYVATEVALKCAGLPVAIATVARALRNKGLHAWKDALVQLQRPSSKNFKGIPREVYLAVELSYNYLESDELRQTFLLCSLLALGNHASIHYLMRIAWGLGLFRDLYTVEETRNRLLTLISDLKASCLLHGSFSNGRFRMHDLVSDVALAIASRDKNVFALKPKDVFKEWPDAEMMEKCTMINFPLVDITHFPKELKGQQLSILRLGSKNSSVEMPASFFKEMKQLKVLQLINMHISFSSLSIGFLTNLQTLILNRCVLENIAIIGNFKSLESFSIIGSDIEMLPKEIGQLCNLRIFDLIGCTKLKIIPYGVLSSLSRLEELNLPASFVEWEVEKHVNQQTNATLAELKVLSNLTAVEIHIPDAKSMSGDLFSGKLERFKIFIGKAWDLINVKYEYSRTLKLSLNITDNGQLDNGIKMLLKKAEDVCLDDMKGAKIALHRLMDIEEGFHHLKNLHVQNCLEIKYILSDNDSAAGNIEFLQLRSLTLESLPQLVSFSCEKNKRGSTSESQYELSLFSEKMLFPCLEKLHLSSITVERIWSHQLSDKSFCSYQNLTSLIVEGCGSLKHIFSSFMARSLVNLKCLEIVDCKCLEEIIFSEEGDIKEEVILFPQLNSLKMKNLEHLLGFCSKKYKIEFKSLKILEIEHCPRLKGFMYKSRVEENRCFSSQALFGDKVSFPSLEKMRISHLQNMKMIWHSQLSVYSFCKLTEMAVEHCNELSTIFPCQMWGTFQRLGTLKVIGCGSLEEIFQLQSLNMEETHAVVATQLRELRIKKTPKLKQVWNKDPRGILTFHNLQVVCVRQCPSLKNVFPPSVARDLRQLKRLKVCQSGVEEIVSKEAEGMLEMAMITFKFEQLSSLMLWNLPKLECFYPGIHSTEWPMLKTLEAYHCGKLKIFDYEDEGQHDSPIQLQPPLFLLEQVLTKLEEVSLNSNEIQMIHDKNKFPGGQFNKIKVLKVLCYHDDESSVFPITFLQRFNNLEKLQVHCCSFQDIFLYGGGVADEINAGTPSHSFKNLKLTGLRNLKHLWKQENSGQDRLFPNLETLKVSCCYDMISLGSSPAPFQNLVTLDVWKCKAMINLVTSSSAVRSLVQLKVLKIRECRLMKAVVGNEGVDHESTDDIIIFRRLKCLELRNLPSLKTFCSDKHTFEFQSLEQVKVIQCPELEIFCKGVLKAPLLQRVQTTEEGKRGNWGGDLNTTLKQLYTNEVEYQGGKYLVLSDSSESIVRWKENLQKSLDFRNLQFLEVHDCGSLKNIFTISMTLSLVQLNQIKVKNCPMLEQVITNEGAKEATISIIMLPRLQTITLESCSNLTSFFLERDKMECLYLKQITVVDCPKMFEFTSVFPRKKDMEAIDGVNSSFFNNKVSCPNLEKLKLFSLNIQKIWPDDQQKVMSCNVQNLMNLDVKGCHNLKYLFLSSLVENLVQLKQLYITDCNSVEEVIYTEKEVTAQMLFPNLQILGLTNLPKLVRFCYRNYSVFPLLRELWIWDCHVFRSFIFAGSLVGDYEPHIAQQEGNNSNLDVLSLFNDKVAFPSLNDLRIDGLGKCRKIWDDKLNADSFWKLSFLLVNNCQRLLNVFPFNMMERLEKLEKLYITNCDSLEEIVLPDHGLTSSGSHSTAKFVFPKMSFLFLEKLPKLKGFYSKVHTTEWPLLQQLEAIGCNKVVTFARDQNLSTLGRQGESQLDFSVQQPLFWVHEDTFPNLEELILEDNGSMEEIWHGPLPTKYFPKLNWLKIKCCPKNAVSLPNCFFHSLPRLEYLDVFESFFNEIFQCERGGDEEEHVGSLARLKGLYLTELPELIHIWKEEILPAKSFSNLSILSVWGCGKLVDVLVPSSVNFKNLTTLEVSGCHGLKKLVTFPAAKTMMLLERMTVNDCQMMEEIVASTSDQVVDSIIFSKLESLELGSLPNLSRFCSGNHYNFGFPSLGELIISQCPKMENFCEGKLITPMLQGVVKIAAEGEYVGYRKGDLNAIIQQSYVEKVVPSMEDLVKSSINLQKIWHWKLLVSTSYARYLTCLTVEGCPNLKCLFSSSMVTSFVQLKMLNVENCENVETVIFTEGLGGEMMSQTSFRILDSLMLKDLPKLTRFCHGNYIEFPLLKFLRIQSCPILKTFISDSVMENQTEINQEAEGNNLEIAPPTLLSEKVAFPCLKKLSIRGVGKWRNIWHDQPTDSVTVHFAN